jgi:hypothetical protein
VAQSYPQALGSIFVTSYDLQGYGGGIQTHLHTGINYNSKSKSKLLYDWRFTANQFVLAASIPERTQPGFVLSHLHNFLSMKMIFP